jgi:hypothetical protein
MKKTVVFATVTAACLGIAGYALSDAERWGWAGRHGDSREHEAESEDGEWEHGGGGWLRSGPDVAPVRDATYEAECGACHFAYQPGLLSADAWGRVMDALADHYGDDASLGPDQAEAIRAYLTTGAADRSAYSRSRAFAALPLASSRPPRITDTPYFRREHHEIPPRLVTGNAQVGSFANCQACHGGATDGVYNEHQVRIPGVGRWDD